MSSVFRRRPGHPPRRRQLFGVQAVIAEQGRATVGVSATGQLVKVADVQGTTFVGPGGAGQAVKSTAQGAQLTAGVGGSAVDRKNATPVAKGGAGVSATTTTFSRVSIQKGTTAGGVDTRSVNRRAWPALVGVATTSTISTKTVAMSGTLTVAVSGAGAAAKVIDISGRRASSGISTVARTIKVIDLAATEMLWLGGFATSPFRANGATDVGITGYSRAAKRAVAGGKTGAGVDGSGLPRRRMPLGGRGVTGLTSWCFSKSKKVPAAGRLVLAVSGRGEAIRAGAVLGNRVAPPLLVGDYPVAGSLVRWEATLPEGTTLKVETSIDNGATYQVVANSGDPIPRLTPGLVISVVLTRVTLTRPTGFSPSPRLHRLETRVTIDGSTPELVQLGRFLINEVHIQDSPDGATIEIAGADLARKLDRNRWDRTVVAEEGTLTTEAIKMLARNRFPSVVLNFVTSNQRIPRLFYGEQAQNSPWDDITKLATDIGCELFFDAYGVLTLRKVPDPSTDESQWEFDDRSKPTITDLARRVSDENTYNYVIVTGESSYNDRPVRGTAVDRDPGSPTYVLGPYGIVTLRITSAGVVTASQAYEAAEALLRKVKGATEQVDISAVPMPAMEPGDVITVARSRSKVEGRFIVETVDMPLGATEPMRLVCRRQRY